MLSLITAIDRQNIIGCDGVVPWIATEDLRNFRRLTWGHSVIMGYKTFASLGYCALPHRKNFVLSREREFLGNDVLPCSSIYYALEFSHAGSESDEVFVIGGRETYMQFARFTDRIHLTIIDSSAQYTQSVVKFPWEAFAGIKWNCMEQRKLGKDFYYQYDRIL